MDDKRIMLWLSLVTGLGSRRISALIEQFEDLQEIWRAGRADLAKVKALPPQIADDMQKTRDYDAILNFEKQMEQKGISYSALHTDEYPPLLSLIHDPPAVVYYKGTLPDMTDSVAIIGSRRCSEYGATVAKTLARDLASRGLTIISGMAKGIDSWAHKGALATSGKTTAVLGSGVDICYPPENRPLYNDIINNGCVLSEYPPGTKPYPTNFPVRNRIISGLSKAVVVVEAALKSGTLITVDTALEQGREVLAVPGNITSKLSSGTNALIKQGAHALVTDYKDILRAINYEFDDTDDYIPLNQRIISLAPDEKLIYDCVGFAPIRCEDIAAKAKITVNAAVNLCTMLEIKGFIKKLPGMRYIKE